MRQIYVFYLTLDYLNKEIISWEQTEAFKFFNHNEIKPSTKIKKSFNSNKSLTSNIPSSKLMKISNFLKNINMFCVHSFILCGVFKNKSLDEKHNILKTQVLCYFCLNYRHMTNSCRKKLNINSV